MTTTLPFADGDVLVDMVTMTVVATEVPRCGNCDSTLYHLPKGARYCSRKCMRDDQ